MRAALRWDYLGLCTYGRALGLQHAHWSRCRAGGPDVCLALEHPPVVTFGLRTPDAERARAATLADRGIPSVATDRGGYATYHGPGQLVVYPIVDLRARDWGVGRFVMLLEEIMIRVAASFDVEAHRDPRGRGVWTSRGKLGSVGIRVREGVSMHGLALNVALDLAPFGWITTCGMPGVRMTSLADEGAVSATVESAAAVAEGACRSLLSADVTPASAGVSL